MFYNNNDTKSTTSYELDWNKLDTGDLHLQYSLPYPNHLCCNVIVHVHPIVAVYTSIYVHLSVCTISETKGPSTKPELGVHMKVAQTSSTSGVVPLKSSLLADHLIRVGGGGVWFFFVIKLFFRLLA